jgi:hypothetical protein
LEKENSFLKSTRGQFGKACSIANRKPDENDCCHTFKRVLWINKTPALERFTIYVPGQIDPLLTVQYPSDPLSACAYRIGSAKGERIEYGSKGTAQELLPLHRCDFQ